MTGVPRATIIKYGVAQLIGEAPLGGERIRESGGGRKTFTEIYPDIEEKLLRIVSDDSQGKSRSGSRSRLNVVQKNIEIPKKVPFGGVNNLV